MIVEYNDVELQNAEIMHIRREGVYDDAHMHYLYTLWNIGVVAVYSPNGWPSAVSTKRVPINPGGLLLDGKGVRGIDSEIRFSALRRVVKAAINPFIVAINFIRGKNVPLDRVVLRGDKNDALGGREKPGHPTEITPPRIGRFPGPQTVRSEMGYGPIVTDSALRGRLMIPQKKLLIHGFDWSSGNDANPDRVKMLESPSAPYLCDPINGPHPIACDVLQGNDMSFAVYFEIQTATLPCEAGSERLILSHTWQMSHTHDQNQYLSRVIDGEVVLNGSMVHSFGLNVDYLRSQIFHPIPLGCYRTVPHVTPSVDGLTYTYQIVDTDQTITFDSGDSGASHIEIVEKLSYYRPWASQVLKT